LQKIIKRILKMNDSKDLNEKKDGVIENANLNEEELKAQSANSTEGDNSNEAESTQTENNGGETTNVDEKPTIAPEESESPSEEDDEVEEAEVNKDPINDDMELIMSICRN